MERGSGLTEGGPGVMGIGAEGPIATLGMDDTGDKPHAQARLSGNDAASGAMLRVLREPAFS